jgi:predicted acetyltransferase
MGNYPETVVRKLAEEDIDRFTTIVENAYPGIKLNSEEARQKFKQRLKEWEEDPRIGHYGAYRQGQLVGGMRFFDFTMKVLSVKAPVGGVGLVAVDVLHKKEHIAYDLIAAFLRHYREQGATLATLYPFRPDFYKKMGFGYGTKINQYRVKPASLPTNGPKADLFFMKKGEEQLLVDCYNRYLERTNGLIEKMSYELNIFDNPELKILACPKPGQPKAISGYMVFSFKSAHPDNFAMNDIIVRELVYDSSEALLSLLRFLNSQADQINQITINSQDEYLHYLFHDPRNGTNNMIPSVFHESNVQGIGIMYRVINTAGLFKLLAQHDFGGQTCSLKLNLTDSFLKENEGSTVIHFEEGRPGLGQAGDAVQVEIGLDVSDFSSLIMGAVNFKTLHSYGLVSLSDPAYLNSIDRLFRTEQRPLCTTPF